MAKTNLNPTSISRPAADGRSGASNASENTPDAGTSSESSISQTPIVTESRLPPETTKNSGSLPAEYRFIGLVESGLTAWIKAGELLVEMVGKDGDKAFQTILKCCPWMNEPMLWNFYRIGQKQLYPKTLIFASNQFVAREIASLSWEVQAEICDCGLPLINGEMLERKPVNELNRSDVSLGISEGKLRGLSEQRALILERKEDDSPRRSTNPARKESRFYYPPEPVEKTEIASVPGISTGFYRVDMKFGVVTFTKIPRPVVVTQKIVLIQEMGDFQAFVEVMRTPVTA